MADEQTAAAGSAGGAEGVAATGGSPPAAVVEDRAPLLGGGADTGDAIGSTDDGAEAPPPAWREDWRERFAGQDEKLLGRLKRFANPENVFKSYLELERKVSSGQLKASLPDGATEAEVAAYRKQLGIPEKPDEYGIDFPKEAAVTDADKAALASFREAAHGLNLPPGQVKGLFEWWTGQRTAAVQQLKEREREAEINAIAELRTEYGVDYKRNVTVADQFVSEHAGDKGPALVRLRLADGSLLGAHPDFVRFAVNAALATADDDTLIVPESGGGGASIGDQLKEAMSVLNSNPRQYWTEEHQAKVLKLKGAQMAQESRRRTA